MTREKILLIGGGGHCRSCIDVIETEGRFDIAGIIDQQDKVGTSVLGYRVIGTDIDLQKFIDQYHNVLITVGQIKTPSLRIKLFNRAKELSANFPVIVSPKAHVSKHATIFEGTIVMHDVVVNAGCTIGENCILNSKALIEHDSSIGAHSHISTGAIVNGDCEVGEGSFIGSRAVLKNGIKIEANGLIKFGSVVER